MDPLASLQEALAKREKARIALSSLPLKLSPVASEPIEQKGVVSSGLGSVSSSVSTSRRIPYELIIQGNRPGYTFHFVPQNEFISKPGLQARICLLAAHVRATLNEFETQCLDGRAVKEFGIGVSHAKARARRILAPSDPTTWSVTGSIGLRWVNYQRQNFYALVVVAAFTRDLLPCHLPTDVDHHTYARALEMGLASYFLFDEFDARFKSNDLSLSRGKIPVAKDDVACVYVAIKLGRAHEVTPPDQVCPNRLCRARISFDEVDTSELAGRLEEVRAPDIRQLIFQLLAQIPRMKRGSYEGTAMLWAPCPACGCDETVRVRVTFGGYDGRAPETADILEEEFVEVNPDDEEEDHLISVQKEVVLP